MPTTVPTTTSLKPPIPISYTSEYRQRQEQEIQRQKQLADEAQRRRELEEQQNKQVETQPVSNERQEVYNYYKGIYGEKLGEDYKDLYFLRKDLEKAKASGFNQSKIDEIQKSINAREQRINKQSFARDNESPKIGIQKNVKQPSTASNYLEGGYSGVTGYSGMGYTTITPKSQQEFKPASNQNFLASSLKGPDYVITNQGELKREPFTPTQGGAVYSREEVFLQPKSKKLQGDVFLDALLQGNEELSQKYFPGYIKPFEVGIRKIKFINEQGRFGIEIYGDTKKGLTTRLGGDRVSNIASSPGRAIYGTTKFLVGITPFTSSPYETIFLTNRYASETYTNPIVRGQKTVAEFSDYISQRGLIAFGVESYVGAKALNPFFEPFENVVSTKFSRIKERILGTDYEFLLKNYSIENIGDSVVIRSKTSGRFSPMNKAPIKIKPTQTIITEPSYLKSLEGKTVLAVHTSPNFQYGGVIETLSKRLSGEKESITLSFQEQRGIRKRLENAPFYFSVPEEGAKGVPTAQAGYAGFSSPSLLEVARQQKFVFFKKTPSLILTKAKVEPTGRPLYGFDIPSKLSNLEEKTVRISAEQERFPGRFTRAPEEVSGLRPFGPELQIVVPTKASAFPLTGRPESVGSILIKQKSLGERIFYETKEPFFFKFLPKEIRLSLFESDFSKRPAKFNLDYGKIVSGVKESSSIYSNNSITNGSRTVREQSYSVRDLGLESVRSRVDFTETATKERKTFQRREFAPRVESFFREYQRREATRELERIISRGRFGRDTFRERQQFRLDERTTRTPERTRLVENNRRRTELIRPRESIIKTRERPSFYPTRLRYYPEKRTYPTRYPKIYQKNDSLLRKVFGQSFSVLYRTRGKVKVLPGFFTQKDAIATGERLLGNTLRASYKIKQTGGLVQERYLKGVPLKGYYNKKGFFVQARGTRLSSRGERFEIQSAKRIKRGFLF